MTGSGSASPCALWNGRDPILKERLFGLTNSESNHGEDVKEYYFYLDNTPTHSYMKQLYKYPQGPFPYADLVDTSRRRSRHEFEYELLDTGAFDDDRYWDVFVEYAKAAPEDILILISVHNRGPEPAHAPRAADALVPEPVVLARQPRQADPPAVHQRHDGQCRQGRRAPRSGNASSSAKGTCRSFSPRTRPTPSASSASPTGPRTSRTASTTSSSMAGKAC